MERNGLRDRVAGIVRGVRVAVLPLSLLYGDEITAVGITCTGSDRELHELSEPFEAVLQDFDGETLTLMTKVHGCIQVSIGDLKDVIPFSTVHS